MFKRPSSDELDSALAENKRAVDEACAMMQRHREHKICRTEDWKPVPIVSDGNGIKTPLAAVGEPQPSLGDQAGMFVRLWSRLVGIFT